MTIHLRPEGETMHPSGSKEALERSKQLRDSSIPGLQPLIWSLYDRVKRIGDVSMEPTVYSAHILNDYLLCAKGTLKF